MVCYGKKGEATEVNNKKNRQMENLSNKYLSEYNVSKSDLTSNELRMINALMYKADSNVFTISGCKGITKSNPKFVAKSLRIIKKDKSNNDKYNIVLQSSNHEMKSMQVGNEELSMMLNKYFGVQCTRCEHKDNKNINSSYEECR